MLCSVSLTRQIQPIFALSVVPKLYEFQSSVLVAVIPVAIGIGPLTVLFALIRNPVAYVTDTGVMQERVFHRTSVSLT